MRFITSSAEFKDIYSNHRKIDSVFFSLLFQRNSKIEESSVGIVISKKIGNAVTRNKVKRWVKHYIREHKNIIKPCYKYIIKAKIESGSTDWNEILNDLNILFTDPQLCR